MVDNFESISVPVLSDHELDDLITEEIVDDLFNNMYRVVDIDNQVTHLQLNIPIESSIEKLGNEKPIEFLKNEKPTSFSSLNNTKRSTLKTHWNIENQKYGGAVA